MENSLEKPHSSQLEEATFNDLESRNNVLGLFDLLLKIDQRTNPEKYHD